MLKTIQSKILTMVMLLVAVVQIITVYSMVVLLAERIQAYTQDTLKKEVQLFQTLLNNKHTDFLNQAKVMAQAIELAGVDQIGMAQRLTHIIPLFVADSPVDAALVMTEGREIIFQSDQGKQFPLSSFYSALEDAQFNAGGSVALAVINNQLALVAIVALNDASEKNNLLLIQYLTQQLINDFQSVAQVDLSITSFSASGPPNIFLSTFKDNEQSQWQDSLQRVSVADLLDSGLTIIQMGQNRIAQAVLLRKDEIKDLKILAVISVPEANQWQEWSQYYRLSPLIITTLVLGGIFSLLLTNRVIAPINAIVLAAQRIKEGIYTQPVTVENKDDEISLLADTFNSMQEGIADRERHIVHQAYHDNLTGLPNRAVVPDRLRKISNIAKQEMTHVAVVTIGLNRFREINDRLGHAIGDLVLQEVARRLVKHLSFDAQIIRLGGDEFLLIIENTQAQASYEDMQQLAQELQRTILLPDMQINLKFSIGIALYPEHAEHVDSILRRSEIAMVQAKSSSDGIKLYQPGQDERHLRELSIINDLRYALENNELFVYYQPKVRIDRHEVVQVEALVRWYHPKHGFMPPDEFIPLAEQSGNIKLLTHWVVKQVIKQCYLWSSQGMKFAVSINISALDLIDGTLLTQVTELLSEFQLPAKRIIFEITESALMQDADIALDLLTQIKSRGLQLSIDDFGKGYSSLARLRKLPVDELKIDKSFIINLKHTSEDAVIVKSTIEIAHNMGLKVTAEGVETEQAWNLLKEYGCDMAQGYLISRPLPFDAVVTWIDHYGQEEETSR